MLELCRSQDLTPAEGIGIKVGGKSHGGSMEVAVVVGRWGMRFGLGLAEGLLLGFREQGSLVT